MLLTPPSIASGGDFALSLILVDVKISCHVTPCRVARTDFPGWDPARQQFLRGGSPLTVKLRTKTLRAPLEASVPWRFPEHYERDPDPETVSFRK